MIRKLVFSACVTALAACATPYGESGFRGGFNEVKLDDRVYQITFKGNAYTSGQRVADFSLLRAAELALENGYPYFAVVNDKDSQESGIVTNPGSMNVAPSVSSYTKYGSTKTIYLMRDREEGVFAYNAKTIYESIRATYGMN